MKKIRIASKTIVGVFFILSILSTLTTGYFSYRLNYSLDENIEFQSKRTESIKIAEELKQSSDELTNFARLYAISEDPFYKEAYQMIIDMRNGDKPIPGEYDGFEWDLAISNKFIPEFKGECISIENRMLDLGMDSEEMEHIKQSKILSDSLAKIELSVFEIIEDNKNDWRIKSEARKKLFDDDYLISKLKIMLPIKEFREHVDLRTRKMVILSEDKAKYYLLITVLTSIITLGMIIMLRLAIQLGRRVNRKVELQREYLESILDSSCLVSRADKSGKITMVNDKFCLVSGYSEKELLGEDHSILNSGHHPRKFWIDMYKTTVIDKNIWHQIVTNRNKLGNQYIVDSYIMATFNEKGEHNGYMSVRQDITELMNSLQEVDRQNVYLEHAAKILRHDMHSGINTYIPRGVKSLERRLEKITENDNKLKKQLDSPMRLIKEGLSHAQKIYIGVREFTNLVKKGATLEKENHNIEKILKEFLKSTSYYSQVKIENIGDIDVNESLFCTAVDNLIRNGLRYNDSETKVIKIYKEKEFIIVEDNGRGMSQKEFEELSKPYTRKKGNKESGSGLGLNICVAIMKEHGFEVSSQKIKNGTKIKIKI